MATVLISSTRHVPSATENGQDGRGGYEHSTGRSTNARTQCHVPDGPLGTDIADAQEANQQSTTGTLGDHNVRIRVRCRILSRRLKDSRHCRLSVTTDKDAVRNDAGASVGECQMAICKLLDRGVLQTVRQIEARRSPDSDFNGNTHTRPFRPRMPPGHDPSRIPKLRSFIPARGVPTPVLIDTCPSSVGAKSLCNILYWCSVHLCHFSVHLCHFSVHLCHFSVHLCNSL